MVSLHLFTVSSLLKQI